VAAPFVNDPLRIPAGSAPPWADVACTGGAAGQPALIAPAPTISAYVFKDIVMARSAGAGGMVTSRVTAAKPRISNFSVQTPGSSVMNAKAPVSSVVVVTGVRSAWMAVTLAPGIGVS
jgi:hypothetical protein